jgi:hypothetical protein
VKNSQIYFPHRAGVIAVLSACAVFSFSPVWAADGSGTNSVNPTTAVIGSTGNTLTFTFTGAETMDSGGISITVPTSWSAPQASAGVAGYTTASSTSGIIATVEDALDSAASWAADSGACNQGLSATSSVLHEGSASLACRNVSATNNTKFYRNLSGAENWSGYTNAAFWIRTSANLSAGQLKFLYDDNTNVASPIASINVPAVTANTWVYANLTLSGVRTSVASFGFQIAGASAQTNTIYIDDLLLGPGLPSFPGSGEISVRFLSLPTSTTASVTYGAGGGASGATAPSVGGVYAFTTRSRASDSGTLTAIASSPSVTINNPVPTTTSISPSSKTAGDPGFTLTVNGTNFNQNSVVHWGGSARTTSFISATQLTATISASDIAVAGSYSVTVVNPSPGGGTSNAQTLTVTALNPVPTTTSISPTSATVGGPGFTLTVNGTNFIASSSVRFNGSDRVTTFIGASQVTAAILAGDLTATGTFPVTVFNPTPGGGTSNAQNFTVSEAPDTAPPTVSISSPTNGATVSGSVTVVASASDNFGVVGVQFKLNGANLEAEDTVTPYSISWNTALSTNGGHALTAVARDAAGNSSTAASVSVTVDNQSIPPPPPPVSPGTPPPPTGGNQWPTTMAFAGESFPNAKISVLGKGGVDPAYRDFPIKIERLSSGGSFHLTVLSLFQGDYIFLLKAEDEDGQESIVTVSRESIGFNEVVAGIVFPPTVRLESAVVAKGKRVGVTGFATPGFSVEIEIDGKSMATVVAGPSGQYAFSTDGDSLGEGIHYVQVRQRNAAGAVSGLSVSRSFRVSPLIFPKADLNSDGIVNVIDWSIFLFRWESKEASERATIDLNSDGTLDVYDFSLFLSDMRV